MGKHVWPGLRPQLKSTQAYFETVAAETIGELYPNMASRGTNNLRSKSIKMGQILYRKVWPQVMAQTFDELQVCLLTTALLGLNAVPLTMITCENHAESCTDCSVLHVLLWKMCVRSL
jgi:hypothetical protein